MLLLSRWGHHDQQGHRPCLVPYRNAPGDGDIDLSKGICKIHIRRTILRKPQEWPPDAFSPAAPFRKTKTMKIANDALGRLDRIAPMIGNTPMISIQYSYRNGPAKTLYAKAEYYNYTGSIKDRMAFHILREAYSAGTLHGGETLAEATSGNTGISFAALGRLLGHPVTICMPDWMSNERVRLLQSFGARIEMVSRADGGFLGSIARCEAMARNSRDVFHPDQFGNPMNCEAHYLTTGPEIVRQMRSKGVSPDAFVAGVGTGGTLMGIGKYLKDRDAKVKVHALEPASSPTLSTGHRTGTHRIQGISDEFIPSIVNLKATDGIVAVEDGDAIRMAQMLARQLGLGVGISSGANFLGAVKLQQAYGYIHPVTLFPDDNKKYLTTDYGGEEPEREGYLTPEIELLGVEVMPEK